MTLILKITSTIGIAVILLTCVGCNNKNDVSSSIPEAPIAEAENNDDPKLYNGDVRFENWRTDDTASVIDAAAKGMNDQFDADQLILNPGLGLIRMHEYTNIDSGDTISANVWLWAEQPETLTFTLVRACSNSNPEVQSTTLQVSTEPQKFNVSNTFEYAHSCFWSRLRGTRDDQRVYAWGYQAYKNDKLISEP